MISIILQLQSLIARILSSNKRFLRVIFLFAVFIRLCFLCALPIFSKSVTCGGYAQTFPMVKLNGNILKVLDNRVQVLPLTEDEHRYHEMAENILKGKGISVSYDWFIANAGKPTAHGGCLYPVFLALIYWLWA